MNPYFRRGYIKFPGADRDRSDPSGSMAVLPHNKTGDQKKKPFYLGCDQGGCSSFYRYLYYYAAGSDASEISRT